MAYLGVSPRALLVALAPVAGTGALIAVLLWGARGEGNAAQQLDRIEESLIELRAFDALIHAQFASVSHHLLSGTDESLAAFRDVTGAEASLVRLRALVYSNAAQRVHADMLSDRYYAWRRSAESQMGLVLAGRMSAPAMRHAITPVERSVSEALDLMDRVERERQREWAARSQSDRRRLALMVQIGGALLAMGMGWLGASQVSALASESAKKYQALADRHADALHEHGQISEKVDELNRLVQERSASLKTVTGQLEALTYAVSRHVRGGLDQTDALLREVWYESLGGPIDRDALRRLGLEIARAQRLLEALLTCAALTRLDLSIERVGIDEVMDGALEDLRASIDRRQAQVTVVPGLPPVQGNRAALVQVFTHLLSNALTFCTDSPRVRVWAHATEGTVRVWMQDNGIGIAPKDQERIFKLFERVDSHANGAGVGVGLAVVRLAVERMGGQSGVESTPGEGSSFWIELPLSV